MAHTQTQVDNKLNFHKESIYSSHHKMNFLSNKVLPKIKEIDVIFKSFEDSLSSYINNYMCTWQTNSDLRIPLPEEGGWFGNFARDTPPMTAP